VFDTRLSTTEQNRINELNNKVLSRSSNYYLTHSVAIDTYYLEANDIESKQKPIIAY